MMDHHSNYHEESTNSSEEADDDVDLGVGRSYECVFCKRGFNTAQALGGHMNIHRKDRARNKPNSTKQHHHHGPRFYQQIPASNDLGIRRFSSPQDHHQPHHFAYASYFPAASSNSTLYESANESDRDQQQPSEPAEDVDWRMSLSLEFEPSSKNIRQDKELDLELRLGYDS